MSRFVITLILLLNSAISFASGAALHHLELGFNLGYPDRVHYFEPAMSEIQRMGIRDVRIYEVFDGRVGNEYQPRLKDALDRVLAHKLRPMLCISNVHARLKPSEAEQAKLADALPLGVATGLAKILTYTNRFPPIDLEAYRASIQELVNFLVSTYGKQQVAEWWFEIGNEPDAPLYFWGDAAQFSAMYRVASEVLLASGLHHVGGVGVTSHPIFLDPADARSAGYRWLMQALAADPKHREFLSFHLYERESRPVMPLSGLPDWLANTNFPVMITEWNVSSRGEVAAKTFDQPGAWGASFIRLLADCARFGIDRLYIFDLMNYPPHGDLQLGGFDITGRARPWFEEFRQIYAVVREGYGVEEDGTSLKIYGKNGKLIVLAKSVMPLAAQVLYAPAGAGSGSVNELAAGQWVIVRAQ